MASVASTASMDLTAVVPALMQGVAQEVGVDLNELKAILVGDEHQVDLKPFQTLQQQHNQVEWDYEKFDQHHNPESYIDICLKQGRSIFPAFQHVPDSDHICLVADVPGKIC